jgi:hypothetical protein
VSAASFGPPQAQVSPTMDNIIDRFIPNSERWHST